MADQTVTDFFNKIYDETYRKTLRVVTSKCGNTNDIADIVQEVYTEVFTVIAKKGIAYMDNPDAFVMQVTKAKVYRHYSIVERLKNIVPLFTRNKDDEEVNAADLELSDNELEDSTVNKLLTQSIWEQLSKKPDEIKKIFYLFYSLDLTIPEIAKELAMSESNVKNKLYRTVKELRAAYQTAVI